VALIARALVALVLLPLSALADTPSIPSPSMSRLAQLLVESIDRAAELKDARIEIAEPIDPALADALKRRLVEFGAAQVTVGGATAKLSIALKLERTGGRLRAIGQLRGPAAPLSLYAEVPDEPTENAISPEVRTLKMPGPAPLALAVSSSGQIAAATADSLQIYTLREDELELAERRPLSGKPPRIRPRTDVVTAAWVGDRFDARSSRSSDGFTLAGLGRCDLSPGFDWFVSCSAAARLPSRFWTAAARGSAIAAIVPSVKAGTLWLTLGRAAPVTRSGVGAQVALTDRLVIITLPADTDALIAAQLSPALPERFRVPLPGPVRAMTTGVLDGRERIFAAVDHGGQAELWIVTP
jgi:hypothetical protein